MRKADFQLGIKEIALILLFVITFLIIFVLLLGFVEPSSSNIFETAQQMEGVKLP